MKFLFYAEQYGFLLMKEMNKSQGLNLIAGTGPYHNPNWIRPTSGLLLEELTKHIKRKIECDQTKNCKDMKKFYAYGTVGSL